MRRLAALLTFALIAGTSATALADRAPSRPAPAEAPADENKAEEAPADENKAEEAPADENKADEKSSSCSVAQEDDAMLAFAAFVLLTSGLVLRRRRI